MPRKEELSADEQKLNDVFEEHLRSAFLAHSADQTMETMVVNPRINEIPEMVAAMVGKKFTSSMQNIFCLKSRRMRRLCGSCGPLVKKDWSMQ